MDDFLWPYEAQLVAAFFAKCPALAGASESLALLRVSADNVLIDHCSRGHTCTDAQSGL